MTNEVNGSHFYLGKRLQDFILFFKFGIISLRIDMDLT